jgi:hypothetical protein
MHYPSRITRVLAVAAALASASTFALSSAAVEDAGIGYIPTKIYSAEEDAAILGSEGNCGPVLN